MVVWEQVYRHLGTDAAHAYGAYFGHINMWCDKRGFEYAGIPVMTAKKFILGTKRKTKR